MPAHLVVIVLSTKGMSILMSTTRPSFVRRVLVSASASALCLTGVLTVAHAADAPVGPQFGNIDQSATGSITVHKREAGAHDLPNVASAAAETPLGTATPVQGVVFTAYKLAAFDPANGEHWKALSTLVVSDDACDDTQSQAGMMALEPGRAFTATDQDGKATLSGLPVGAYLVCETSAPSTVVKKARPFIVTMPYADAATKGWVYHVHAYPKNTVLPAPVKAQRIGTNGMNTAGDFTYTITTQIPRLADKEHFKYFTVADPMVSQMKDVKVGNVKVDGQPVAPGHYDQEVVADKDYVAVHFTRDGLNELKNHPAGTLEITFVGTLETMPDDGVVKNRAYVYVDTVTQEQAPTAQPTKPAEAPDAAGDVPTAQNGAVPHPTNQVGSKWGQFKILKHDAADGAPGNQKPLQGAVYEVYLAADQTVVEGKCTSTTISGNAISIGGKHQFTSDTNGIVDIPGLLIQQAAGVQNAEPALDAAQRCYVVKEVTAPVGYTLPADPATTAITVTPGVSRTHDLPLPNTKLTAPQLPLTGASGRVLMLLGGAAFVSLAVGGALVSRRRAAHQQ